MYSIESWTQRVARLIFRGSGGGENEEWNSRSTRGGEGANDRDILVILVADQV